NYDRPNHFIKIENFKSLKQEFVVKAVLPTLEVWSLELDHAITLAKEESHKFDVQHQFYEQSPFKNFPLLKINESYHCISPSLIDAKIESCLYDTLKRSFGDKFTQEFGIVAEDHMHENLEFSELMFKREKELTAGRTNA